MSSRVAGSSGPYSPRPSTDPRHETQPLIPQLRYMDQSRQEIGRVVRHTASSLVIVDILGVLGSSGFGSSRPIFRFPFPRPFFAAKIIARDHSTHFHSPDCDTSKSGVVFAASQRVRTLALSFLFTSGTNKLEPKSTANPSPTSRLNVQSLADLSLPHSKCTSNPGIHKTNRFPNQKCQDLRSIEGSTTNKSAVVCVTQPGIEGLDSPQSNCV
ncbi:hypothetical protein DFH09DRAFT_1077491 [Mycena vulgaris]|nr:hypothetical protein DFH09DRAFT_1077491 [Mycena vulgaris]